VVVIIIIIFTAIFFNTSLLILRQEIVSKIIKFLLIDFPAVENLLAELLVVWQDYLDILNECSELGYLQF
jgi:hypothetical protein